MNKDQLIKDIQTLKEKHNALILAHFYEDGDIQDIADHVGDSLYLAQMGEQSTKPVILLAGVVFMGESVKILSPEKTVLVPDLKAGCSLVDSSPYKEYKAWKDSHPNSILVSYVNCSAEAKTLSDVICTSSNAEKIIHSIPKDKKILFGPDENLGKFLSKKLNREMTIWPGSCEVHVLFSAKKIYSLLQKNPDAVMLAHPECQEAVLDYAHIVGSTSRLLKETRDNPATTFIVATEPGIIHQMKKSRPDAHFIEAPVDEGCSCNHCPYMKLNTLEKIKQSLENLSPQIYLEPELIDKAKISLNRMMLISRGESVSWD